MTENDKSQRMRVCVPLSALDIGERGRLLPMAADHPLSARLPDLGWLCGSVICCVAKSPAADPVAYRTAGVTVALRLCDAAGIMVEVVRERAGDEETAERTQSDCTQPLSEEADEDACIPGAYGDWDESEASWVCGDTYETAR